MRNYQPPSDEVKSLEKRFKALKAVLEGSPDDHHAKDTIKTIEAQIEKAMPKSEVFGAIEASSGIKKRDAKTVFGALEAIVPAQLFRCVREPLSRRTDEGGEHHAKTGYPSKWV